MPANIECPCGHTVRVPDDLVNTRIKCPVCGELLSVAAAQSDHEPRQEPHQPPVPPSKVTEDSTAASTQSTSSEANAADSPDPTSSGLSRPTSNLHGKGAFTFAGLPTPAFFTKASVALLPERVRIKSSGPFGARHLDLRLSEVTSVETRRPGWFLLLPGILLLPANGVGVVFLILFMLLRHSYLIVRCGNTSVAIRFSGDDTDARAAGDDILQAAQAE
jgi:Na+-transporting methylmalonyl-CoA/oxaloacetate decarboxylase gamma subunit